VPYDTSSYNAYSSLRPTLAYARDTLTATALSSLNDPKDSAGVSHQYALAPNLAPLMPIFNAGKLGVILNAGTLVQPTTKLQYTNKSAPLPPKLFSHNDQQSVWQSSLPKVRRLGRPHGRSVSGCEYKFDVYLYQRLRKRGVFIGKYSGAVSGIDQRISAVIGLADIRCLARKNALLPYKI
jgi:hypothetical protein